MEGLAGKRNVAKEFHRVWGWAVGSFRKSSKYRSSNFVSGLLSAGWCVVRWYGTCYLSLWPGRRSAATQLGGGGNMRPILALKVSGVLGTLIVCLAMPAGSSAQTVDVSGRYRCAQAKVRGKVVPCTAAPLTLKNDGKFELRGWEGSYLVNGLWVELLYFSWRAQHRDLPSFPARLRYAGV